MSNWKEEFVKCLEGSTSGQSLLEKALAMKAENMPEHIYRYQSDVDFRRDSLANDKIWLGSPDKWNDPYDCEFVISNASIGCAVCQNGTASISTVGLRVKALRGSGCDR